MFESLWKYMFGNDDKLLETDSLQYNNMLGMVSEYNNKTKNKIGYLENTDQFILNGDYTDVNIKLQFTNNDYNSDILSGKYTSNKAMDGQNVFIIDNINSKIDYTDGYLIFYVNSKRVLSVKYVLNVGSAEHSSVAINTDNTRLIITIHYDKNTNIYRITKVVYYPKDNIIL